MWWNLLFLLTSLVSAFLTNIRMVCKVLHGANTLAYLSEASFSDEFKKFNKIDTRAQYYKTFYFRNLRIFVIS
jgi:hypothetical protein